MQRIRRPFNSAAPAAVAGLIAFSLVAAVACGSGSSNTSATATSSPATPSARRARFAGNRTPNPAIETSIAEGTPPPFGNRTPPPAVQTAIAEGTPRSALLGGFAGGRELATVAFIIGITPQQLLSELQAPGASIQSVAAAHGKDRATVRQALIDANRQRLATEVSSGTITQAQADQQQSQFESRVDSLIDRVGTAGG